MVVGQAAVAGDVEAGGVDTEQLDALLNEPAQGIGRRIGQLAAALVPIEAEEGDIAGSHTTTGCRGALQLLGRQRLALRFFAQVQHDRLAEEALEVEVNNAGAIFNRVQRCLNVSTGVAAHFETGSNVPAVRGWVVDFDD